MFQFVYKNQSPPLHSRLSLTRFTFTSLHLMYTYIKSFLISFFCFLSWLIHLLMGMPIKSSSSAPTANDKMPAPAPVGAAEGGMGSCWKGKSRADKRLTTGYRGVRQRTWGKWVAEILEPNCGSRIWLGTFDSAYDAAVAYDTAARDLYGPHAVTNLPKVETSNNNTNTNGGQQTGINSSEA